MSALICNQCKGVTNTTLCIHNFDLITPVTASCYAKIKNGKWEKGCAYDKADTCTKKYVDKIILDEDKSWERTIKNETFVYDEEEEG